MAALKERSAAESVKQLNKLSSGEETLNRRTAQKLQSSSGEHCLAGVEPSKIDPTSDEQSLTGGKSTNTTSNSAQPQSWNPPQIYERR